MCAGRFQCGTPSRHSAKGNSGTHIPALPPTSRVILGRTHHLSGAQLHLSKKSIGSDHPKAPSGSDLLGSLLSKEPHLWGRGNRSILSAQIQPRHTLARPHPAHLACSCCHTGRTSDTDTRLFPHPTPPARATGGWLCSCGTAGAWEDRGRGWERRGKGRGAGGE